MKPTLYCGFLHHVKFDQDSYTDTVHFTFSILQHSVATIATIKLIRFELLSVLKIQVSKGVINDNYSFQQVREFKTEHREQCYMGFL